jgi:hypothetical protein
MTSEDLDTVIGSVDLTREAGLWMVLAGALVAVIAGVVAGVMAGLKARPSR